MLPANRRGLIAGALVLGAVACGEPAGKALPGLSPEEVPPETSTDYALSFDGEHQYATTATGSFPLAKLSQSITMWIKPTAGDEAQAIFTVRRGMESGTEIGLSEGRVNAWRVYGPRVFVQDEQALAPGSWHHVAHVQTAIDMETDEYEQRLYVDGELVAEGTQAPASRTPISGWLGSFDGSTQMYAGLLDDLRFYARALSPEEVSDEAAGVARPATNRLVLSFSFNEDPSGSVVYDRSGTGNHATLGDGVPSLMPGRVVSDAPRRAP